LLNPIMDLLVPFLIASALLGIILLILLIIWAFKPKKTRESTTKTREDIKKIKQKINEDID